MKVGNTYFGRKIKNLLTATDYYNFFNSIPKEYWSGNISNCAHGHLKSAYPNFELGVCSYLSVFERVVLGQSVYLSSVGTSKDNTKQHVLTQYKKLIDMGY